MRTATLPLALALTLAVIGWFFQSHALGDDHGHTHAEKSAQQADQTAESWKRLLATVKLGKADRALLEELRPFLNPDDYLALEPGQQKTLLRYAENRLKSDTPIARCWSPQTPPHLLFAFHAVEEAARTSVLPGEAPRKARQFLRRWGHSASNGPGQNVQGRPITLTWSIVPDGTPIPSDPSIGDSSDPSDLRARLAEIYGGDTGPPENQPWFPLFRDLFAAISAHTGIHYSYEETDDGQQISPLYHGRLGDRGDIRLGGHKIDGNGSTIAYNYFPDNGDMIIDTDDNWFENISNNSVLLANTIAHEHGHGIGLEHVCPINQTKLLEPFINTAFRGMQFDEIYTLQRWYGDPFEQHGSARDNDSIPSAKSLPVSIGSPFEFAWLSIDDDSDVDYYSIVLPPRSQLTARVIPTSALYLEGAQSPLGACVNETPFDSSSNHDLTLELLNRNSSVITSASGNPAGEPEEILSFGVPAGGNYYLRVKGGSSDSAQLYRLEVAINAPAVSIALQNHSIVAESHSPANKMVEPGETIQLEIELVNNGTLNVMNVQATLNGPPGFTGFTPVQSYGTLAPGAHESSSFVFALQGNCGDAMPLQLFVTADGGYAKTIPIRMTLGTVTSLFKERFDLTGGLSLPVGWTTSNTGAGSAWNLSTQELDTPAYSIFAADVEYLGTSTLTAPAATLGPLGGTLRFRHNFDTEASLFNPMVGFDGGVLEMSIAGEAWEDILAAGATFTQGAYTHTMSAAYQNPLPNRRGWSGHSGGWITTEVDLPPSLGEASVQFRWRFGHDTSAAEVGWFLDTIELTSASCDHTSPVVHLVVDDDTASEWAPLDRAHLTISTNLPPLSDLAILLLNAGTATLGQDATGLNNITLHSGETSVQVEVLAVTDSAIEGDETLLLSLDPAGGLLLEGAPPAAITISDPPYGTWAAQIFGLGTASGPLDDFDLDGALNLEEYAWHTDATSASSRPIPTYHQDGDFLRAAVPFSTLPGDVFLRAEASSDLKNWSPAGVETLADGFRVPIQRASQRYLRVLSDLISPP